MPFPSNSETYVVSYRNELNALAGEIQSQPGRGGRIHKAFLFDVLRLM